MTIETVPHSTLLIFYDKTSNCFQLSKRPDGSVIFPSEKGGCDPKSTALRGIKEEMGDSVTDLSLTILPGNFSFAIGDLGTGVVDIALIDSWNGQIQNIDVKKDQFYWVSLDKVMNTLSLTESKFAFLIVLFELLRKKSITANTLIAELTKAPTLKTIY